MLVLSELKVQLLLPSFIFPSLLRFWVKIDLSKDLPQTYNTLTSCDNIFRHILHSRKVCVMDIQKNPMAFNFLWITSQLF